MRTRRLRQPAIAEQSRFVSTRLKFSGLAGSRSSKKCGLIGALRALWRIGFRSAPTEVIFATDKLIAGQPQAVRAFLKG
jgi:hypothetical protein